MNYQIGCLCGGKFGLHQPATYQIEVVSHLNPKNAVWFDNLNITHQYTAEGTPTTLITGELPDQAALHGLLSKICNLGLPLLSVNRVD